MNTVTTSQRGDITVTAESGVSVVFSFEGHVTIICDVKENVRSVQIGSVFELYDLAQTMRSLSRVMGHAKEMMS